LVLEADPEQQGLKHGKKEFFVVVEHVLEADPEQQGLKL